mgnify:CR=1 FL=1
MVKTADVVSVSILYTLAIAAAIKGEDDSWIQFLGKWTLKGLFGIHLLEYVIIYVFMRRLPHSLHHFINTMLFGFKHWLPLLKDKA